jgi:16S rRNA (uracil1498-N3)-methyltransferase
LTSNQFYVPKVEPGASSVFLEGSEHRHLAKAARVRAGDTIWLFDDEGTRYRARVESVSAERTELRVMERTEPEGPRVRLSLVQALLPARQMEWTLQKIAELGFSEFIPVETERSIRSPRDRSGRKVERWSKIAREAVKQSKGAAVPRVREAASLREFLVGPRRGLWLFLNERGGTLLREILTSPEYAGDLVPTEVVFCVGPEGGWSDDEVERFLAAGFEPVSLGTRVLKAETAAIAAAAMFAHFWNE